MRLAILATSAYAQTDKLTELAEVTWHVDGLAQRLTEPDAGYTVYVSAAERGLAEQVEQLMADASQSEPIEALLFYFAGYAVVSDERGPALLLDGERLSTLSLRRLRRLRERARSGERDRDQGTKRPQSPQRRTCPVPSAVLAVSAFENILSHFTATAR